MRHRRRLWLAAFGLLGLGASFASLYIHYRILQDPAYSSFCNLSATINCEAVYTSRFGSIRGVPIALGGVIWFALVLLVTLGAGSRDTSEDSSLSDYLFALSVPAVSIALFLAYVSIVLLKTVCVLCGVVDLAIIGIFVLSGASTRTPLGALPGRVFRDLRTLGHRPQALTAAILFVAGAASAVAFFPRALAHTPSIVSAPMPANERLEFDKWFGAQPRVPIELPAEGAQVLIVKFNDYQCPACAHTWSTDAPILARYQAERPGAVKLVLKDYPLEPECNASVTRVIHEAACEGAAAVRLAQQRGRGPEMQRWLYEHQPGMTPAAVRQAAREIGEISDFDIEYPRMLALIRTDAELGDQLGVNGTPTFFINGVRIEGGLQPIYLDAAIADELGAANSAKP